MFRDIAQLIPIIAMAIPILAVAGGIVAAIVRIIGQQRLMELAHKERIAAIERGIDPSKLTPLPGPEHYAAAYGSTPSSSRRRAQGLVIGGLITLAVGIGLSIVAATAEPSKSHWVIGVIPMAVGIALLVSAWLVWPRGSSAPS